MNLLATGQKGLLVHIPKEEVNAFVQFVQISKDTRYKLELLELLKSEGLA